MTSERFKRLDDMQANIETLLEQVEQLKGKKGDFHHLERFLRRDAFEQLWNEIASKSDFHQVDDPHGE